MRNCPYIRHILLVALSIVQTSLRPCRSQARIHGNPRSPVVASAAQGLRVLQSVPSEKPLEDSRPDRRRRTGHARRGGHAQAVCHAGGVPVLARTVGVFLEAPDVDLVAVVIGAGRPRAVRRSRRLPAIPSLRRPRQAGIRGSAPCSMACAPLAPHAPGPRSDP